MACICTCGHGHRQDGVSTAQTQAEQAELLIARNKQEELDDAETKEQQRLFLGNQPRFVHYIGPPPVSWPEGDRTDEEFKAEVEAHIGTFDSYED